MENLEKQPQRRIVSHHFWKWVRAACVGRFPTIPISFAVCVSFAGTGPPCSLRERYHVGPPPKIAFRLSSEAGAHVQLAHAVVNRIGSEPRGDTTSFSPEEAVF